MSWLPSEIRKLRRRARRRLQNTKEKGEARTKREIWKEGLSHREIVAIYAFGSTPDRFWNTVRDGHSSYMSCRKREFEAAMRRYEQEYHGGQRSFTPITKSLRIP